MSPQSSEIDPVLESASEQAKPSDEIVLHSYFSGSTIGRITETLPLKTEQDFTNVYKVPARGNVGGGTPFELKRSGRKVQKLELWSNWATLRGVQVTFDDGAIMKAGTLVDQSRSISFHPDESVVSTTISSSAYRTGRAGNLIVKTDFGQEYLGVFPPLPALNKFTPFTDVTRGTLIGVYGGSGSDLDSLGLILALPEDTEYVYSNVRYDLSAFKAVGERLLSLKEGIVDNPSDGTVNQALLFSHVYTSTKSWSNTVGLKLGVKTTISTGVPFLVEGKVELSLEANYSYTWGESVADQKTDSWTVTVTAPPKSHIRVVATVTESTIDVPYVADLVVRRSDGSSKTITNFSGIYKGINVSRFDVKAENIP
jgi:Clostridium epsilon toxin ETX/Bacillus mosquitocidal toxin MTX2